MWASPGRWRLRPASSASPTLPLRRRGSGRPLQSCSMPTPASTPGPGTPRLACALLALVMARRSSSRSQARQARSPSIVVSIYKSNSPPPGRPAS
eukprot:9391807-Alexandrium_andersonii.AAC.1